MVSSFFFSRSSSHSISLYHQTKPLWHCIAQCTYYFKKVKFILKIYRIMKPWSLSRVFTNYIYVTYQDRVHKYDLFTKINLMMKLGWMKLEFPILSKLVFSSKVNPSTFLAELIMIPYVVLIWKYNKEITIFQKYFVWK